MAMSGGIDSSVSAMILHVLSNGVIMVEELQDCLRWV